MAAWCTARARPRTSGSGAFPPAAARPSVRSRAVRRSPRHPFAARKLRLPLVCTCFHTVSIKLPGAQGAAIRVGAAHTATTKKRAWGRRRVKHDLAAGFKQLGQRPGEGQGGTHLVGKDGRRGHPKLAAGCKQPGQKPGEGTAAPTWSAKTAEKGTLSSTSPAQASRVARSCRPPPCSLGATSTPSSPARRQRGPALPQAMASACARPVRTPLHQSSHVEIRRVGSKSACSCRPGCTMLDVTHLE